MEASQLARRSEDASARNVREQQQQHPSVSTSNAVTGVHSLTPSIFLPSLQLSEECETSPSTSRNASIWSTEPVTSWSSASGVKNSAVIPNEMDLSDSAQELLLPYFAINRLGMIPGTSSQPERDFRFREPSLELESVLKDMEASQLARRSEDASGRNVREQQQRHPSVSTSNAVTGFHSLTPSISLPSLQLSEECKPSPSTSRNTSIWSTEPVTSWSSASGVKNSAMIPNETDLSDSAQELFSPNFAINGPGMIPGTSSQPERDFRFREPSLELESVLKDMEASQLARRSEDASGRNVREQQQRHPSVSTSNAVTGVHSLTPIISLPSLQLSEECELSPSTSRNASTWSTEPATSWSLGSGPTNSAMTPNELHHLESAQDESTRANFYVNGLVDGPGIIQGTSLQERDFPFQEPSFDLGNVLRIESTRASFAIDSPGVIPGKSSQEPSFDPGTGLGGMEASDQVRRSEDAPPPAVASSLEQGRPQALLDHPPEHVFFARKDCSTSRVSSISTVSEETVPRPGKSAILSKDGAEPKELHLARRIAAERFVDRNVQASGCPDPLFINCDKRDFKNVVQRLTGNLDGYQNDGGDRGGGGGG